MHVSTEVVFLNLYRIVFLFIFCFPTVLVGQTVSFEFPNTTGTSGKWRGDVHISVDGFSRESAECVSDPVNLRYVLEETRLNLLKAFSMSGAIQAGQDIDIQVVIVLDENSNIKSFEKITNDVFSLGFYASLPEYSQFPELPKDGKCIANKPFKYSITLTPKDKNEWRTPHTSNDISNLRDSGATMNGSFIGITGKVTKISTGYKGKPIFQLELHDVHGKEVVLVGPLMDVRLSKGDILEVLGDAIPIQPQDDKARALTDDGFMLLGLCIVNLSTDYAIGAEPTKDLCNEWYLEEFPERYQ